MEAPGKPAKGGCIGVTEVAPSLSISKLSSAECKRKE